MVRESGNRMRRLYAAVISLALLVATPGVATAYPYPRPAGNQQAIDYVIARALAQRGFPFSYGVGNASGPSRGSGTTENAVGLDPAGNVVGLDPALSVVGFDASGLMVYAFAGVGVKLPRSSGEQYKVGQKIPPDQPRWRPECRAVLGQWADAGGHRSGCHGVSGADRQHDSISGPNHRVISRAAPAGCAP